MGEIKSTLDLVMERTKHLSLSDEERREHELSDLKMRIKGLVLKAQDQSAKIEQIERELNDLKEEQGSRFQKILREELLNEIVLDRDNRMPVILLRRLGKVGTEKLETLLHNYRREMQEKSAEREQSSRIRLKEFHAVSGSAVVPNLETDKEWVKAANKINDEFSLLLEKEKNRLMQQA